MGLDGQSLRLLFEDSTAPSIKKAYAHWNQAYTDHPELQSAIRDDDWRLIVCQPEEEIEGYELFDFRNNPNGESLLWVPLESGKPLAPQRRDVHFFPTSRKACPAPSGGVAGNLKSALDPRCSIIGMALRHHNSVLDHPGLRLRIMFYSRPAMAEPAGEFWGSLLD